MRMKLKAAFLLLSALATAALAAPFPANKDASGGLKAAINALNAAGLLNNAAACSSDPNCANDPFDASRPRCGYAGCTNPPYWDVSQVTNMYELFEHMTGNRMDVSRWDTSSVTNMGRMFHRNFAFNGDISAWDVSKVTNMKSMFGGARAFNRPIGKWDVSSVQDCREMFVNAWEFNQPIGNWDTSSATRMSNMFQSASDPSRLNQFSTLRSSGARLLRRLTAEPSADPPNPPHASAPPRAQRPTSSSRTFARGTCPR